MAKPRTIADVDRQLTEMWEHHRAAVDFWRVVDSLLDVRLTLAARVTPSHL